MTGEAHDSSVGGLKSRFELLQAQTKAKPPIPAKPGKKDATKPGPGTKPKPAPEEALSRSPAFPSLARTDTVDSTASDPFGSPVNSPKAECEEPKPFPPVVQPRFVLSRDVSPASSPSNKLVGVGILLLSIMYHTDKLGLDIPRPASARPPPPPSPRLKSPKPLGRKSLELSRPDQSIFRNIFDDDLETDPSDLKRDQSIYTVATARSRNNSSDTLSIPSSSRPSSRNGSLTAIHPLSSTRSPADRPPTLSARPTSPSRSKASAPSSLPPYPVPSRRKDEDDIGTKPALPIRPLSISSQLSNITPIAEVASPVLPESKPQLPRRLDLINSMPPPTMRNGTEAPRLPSRTNVPDQRRVSGEQQRSSLQLERKSLDSSSPGRSSLDSNRTAATKTTGTTTLVDGDSEGDEEISVENSRSLEQPDASTANRKPPRFKGKHWDITTGKEIRKFAICGDLLMAAQADKIKLFNILTDEVTWQIPVVDTRVTAMEFRTVNIASMADHGRFLWIGYKDGSLHEIDVWNRVIVERYFHCHSSAMVAILRCGRAMWTLDEGGNLYIWSEAEAISLKGRPKYRSLRTVIGVSTALEVDGCLWVGSGRSVHVFDPSATGNHQITHDRGLEPIRVTGLITCAVYLPQNPDFVYFGHDDGKISVFNKNNPKCVEVISVSHYNLSGLVAIGDYLWASFKTGKIFVYDVQTKPWGVMKEWTAHKSSIIGLAMDRSGLWREKRLQVCSVGGDGQMKIWDGLLMDDWLDSQMQKRIAEFSTFEEVSALVCTWNAGAVIPSKMSRDYEDAQFIENMIRESDDPDMIVFGFQELVDLDDKGKAGRSVAKGFFGKKKEKEPDEKAQAIAYQLWQNHLEKQVSIASSASDGYILLQVRNLVGLFTCLFVKRSLQRRIKYVDATSVKTGLKGRYGNKGGIVIRLTLDDTSMCFVNCHLAAGQKHVVGRNNDVFSILDQAGLPTGADAQIKNNGFVCGGDGSMVLDHEICILNGDLNYRINGARSNVLQNIKDGKLNKLLENDQLLVELRKNATHRLRSFTEAQIRFNPTYKFDPGTDNYDSSEKMRVPAWCDRVYFRGLGSSQIQCHSYRDHTCRVSDHRPVSALLVMRVKTVDHASRSAVFESVVEQWRDLANKTIIARKIWVLKEVTGCPERECREALKRTNGQVVADAALALIK